MKPDLPNRLRSLVKLAIILLMIIASALFTVPNARSQQKQDAKSKQETKKTTTPPKRRKRTVGLWESLKGTFDIGGRVRSLSGDRTTKFEENREVPKSFFVRNFKFQFESPDTPFFLNFKGQEMGERDERFGAEVGRVGKFRTRVLWDQIPHSYSNGRTFHLGAGGLLAVNPDLRASLQAVPDAGVPASQLGPTLPNLVRQATQNQAGVTLRVRSDQFWLTQSYHPTKNWEFYLRLQTVHLNGTRPQGTGTFAREGNGPNGDSVWESLGMELPLPEDYRTVNLTLGVQYSRPKWRIGFDYHLSQFRNSFPSLTWQNPFRVTDALAVAPAFGAGRNRFAQAQLALPPDNDFHSFSIHGSVDLPLMTQLRGQVTWGRETQNQPFLPYTLNSAMISANLPAGVPGLFNLPPPQSSLNGVVNTLNQDYTAATSPGRACALSFSTNQIALTTKAPGFNSQDFHLSAIRACGLLWIGTTCRLKISRPPTHVRTPQPPGNGIRKRVWT